MINNPTALDAALNVVSPDSDSYVNGWNAYEHVMQTDPETDPDIKEDKAIHYAIGVAAPVLDFEIWWKAYRTYYDTPQDDQSSAPKQGASGKVAGWLASLKPQASSGDQPKHARKIY